MKNYPINDLPEATHTVRVAFQVDEYQGYAYYKIGGNTKGWQVLGGSDVVEELSDAALSDSLVFEKMKLTLTDEIFDIELTDDAGNTCTCIDEIEWLNKLIVGIEIVKYE